MKVVVNCYRIVERDFFESDVVLRETFEDVRSIIPCDDGFSVVLNDSLLQFVYKKDFYYSLEVED